MKHVSLIYSDDFIVTPVTGWAHGGYKHWVRKSTPSGQNMRHRLEVRPYFTSRRKWCGLVVHLQGVRLIFGDQIELDHVRGVLGRKVIQGWWHSEAGHMVGLANRDWLSRLPKAAKTQKFRRTFEKLVSSQNDAVVQFRKFYEPAGITP